MSSHPVERVPIEPQKVDAPLTTSAIFLVLVVSDEHGAIDTVRDVLGGLDDLVKDVAFRNMSAELSCIAGIGARIWDELTHQPKPAELHPFKEFAGATHTAIATPGDIFFHIRSDETGMSVEMERLLLDALGTSVTTADEVSGFRYFDARDLLGFVDGTANPVGPKLPESTVVGDEDPRYAGGSYVVVQKYIHPLSMWNALTTEEQEAIIGRRKADNVELPDATKGQKSHKTLSTITDANGVEHDILRDNMPFARPGRGEYGTYFIGYTRRLWVLEKMLERMFIGDPPGLHDRILDFSTPHTGSTFFVPAANFLSSLADVPAESDEGEDDAGNEDPGELADVPPRSGSDDTETTDPGSAGSGDTDDHSLGLGSLRDADERTTS